MSTSASAALRKAVRGLLFMSEIDAPFKVVKFKEPPTAATIAEQLDKPSDSEVEEVSPTKFFADLTKPEKWHAEDDKAVIKRYRDLLNVLRENLTGLKVYKVGRVRVKIAILGKTDAGEVVGIVTDSLET
jgi:hypothetical protein